MEALIRERLVPGSDYMDDAAIHWFLTGDNFQVIPERKWFLPFAPSGEVRVESTINSIRNLQRQFFDLTKKGDLLGAVEISKRLEAELALFAYLVETKPK